uniref:Uncharacterized protein n=1 Tax=Fervidobacterium thailandense TaxID=1008305 RepID=A0A7C4GGC1_9BACT
MSEKMYSYVKYEHELETEYREKLAEAKRKSDVRKIFAEYVLRLIQKINPDVPMKFVEDIRFDEKEFSYQFNGDLSKIVEEIGKNSDLMAIINRMYETATHRYKKIEHDENTNYFRMTPETK